MCAHTHTRGINTIIIDEIELEFLSRRTAVFIGLCHPFASSEGVQKVSDFLSRSRDKITNMKEKKKKKKLHELARLDRCFHIAEKNPSTAGTQIRSCNAPPSLGEMGRKKLRRGSAQEQKTASRGESHRFGNIYKEIKFCFENHIWDGVPLETLNV